MEDQVSAGLLREAVEELRALRAQQRDFFREIRRLQWPVRVLSSPTAPVWVRTLPLLSAVRSLRSSGSDHDEDLSDAWSLASLPSDGR